MNSFMKISLLACIPFFSLAQISGTVSSIENGEKKPLPGANVFWEGTETGTVTNENGYYSLQKQPGHSTLVVSFIGYQSQTKMIISRKGTVDFTLQASGNDLETVEVTGEVDATTVDITRPDLTYKIDNKELRKAACCNLSESFETNASVDVSFTDAVTGTRQIEMLGLSGKYALIQRENIPFARGLNANTGLTYIPGPFVESIQLTKGLSSVLNGYESITGQINVEFYKPETAPRLFLNLFGNQGARMELNAISALDVGEHLSTAILAHASTIPFAQDGNQDGFADIPTGSQLNFSNRWHYHNDESGWEGQIGINAIQDDKTGGQVDFINEQNPADSLWGYDSRGRRIELFGKNGYVFKNQPFRSLGFIYSLNYQDRSATFGRRHYEGKQKGFYLNTIYQDIFGNTAHKYRTGISVQAENVKESLSRSRQMLPEEMLYRSNRNEVVPGAYFEYTYEPDMKFTLVGGVRADYNSYFEKIYFTPRINLRYMASENTTLRLGGGRGQRTANIIAENLSILASNRTLNLAGTMEMMPEVGWNSGASITQNIPLGQKDLKVTVDGFYTWFDNKLVTDLDFNPTEAYLLYSSGSRSFSLLGQLDYEIITDFNIRLAYKYLNSQDNFIAGMDQSYLIPLHRAFVNLAYSTDDQWKFDLTVNRFGEKRLPNTGSSPEEFRRPSHSPAFFTVNAQINKVLNSGLEFYVGVDNLLNFKQEDPIVNSDNPYAPYFDTNFTWGPIFGRNIYVGLYYQLDRKE